MDTINKKEVFVDKYSYQKYYEGMYMRFAYGKEKYKNLPIVDIYNMSEEEYYGKNLKDIQDEIINELLEKQKLNKSDAYDIGFAVASTIAEYRMYHPVIEDDWDRLEECDSKMCDVLWRKVNKENFKKALEKKYMQYAYIKDNIDETITFDLTEEECYGKTLDDIYIEIQKEAYNLGMGFADASMLAFKIQQQVKEIRIHNPRIRKDYQDQAQVAIDRAKQELLDETREALAKTQKELEDTKKEIVKLKEEIKILKNKK